MWPTKTNMSDLSIIHSLRCSPIFSLSLSLLSPAPGTPAARKDEKKDEEEGERQGPSGRERTRRAAIDPEEEEESGARGMAIGSKNM